MLQTCRRHPAAGRFMATCSGCAQELHDIQERNRRNNIAADIRHALGLTRTVLDDDETPARVSVYDIRTLDDVYTRVGGTVTVRPYSVKVGDEMLYAIEVTITTVLPGIGKVQAFTDWDTELEPHGWTLPVIRSINPQLATV